MKNEEILNTKWGNAKLDHNGYYHITSRKEGNCGKYLHRLIFEDFYGEIPTGYNVHHKNEKKTDNCIMNLQLMEPGEHVSLHKKGENHYLYGEHHSEKTMKKMSETQNSSGYFRVSKKKNSHYKQGFFWKYQYYENGKRKNISSVDIEKLKQKVLDKGLEWYIIDEEKAKRIGGI